MALNYLPFLKNPVKKPTGHEPLATFTDRLQSGALNYRGLPIVPDDRERFTGADKGPRVVNQRPTGHLPAYRSELPLPFKEEIYNANALHVPDLISIGETHSTATEAARQYAVARNAYVPAAGGKHKALKMLVDADINSLESRIQEKRLALTSSGATRDEVVMELADEMRQLRALLTQRSQYETGHTATDLRVQRAVQGVLRVPAEAIPALERVHVAAAGGDALAAARLAPGLVADVDMAAQRHRAVDAAMFADRGDPEAAPAMHHAAALVAAQGVRPGYVFPRAVPAVPPGAVAAADDLFRGIQRAPVPPPRVRDFVPGNDWGDLGEALPPGDVDLGAPLGAGAEMAPIRAAVYNRDQMAARAGAGAGAGAGAAAPLVADPNLAQRVADAVGRAVAQVIAAPAAPAGAAAADVAPEAPPGEVDEGMAAPMAAGGAGAGAGADAEAGPAVVQGRAFQEWLQNPATQEAFLQTTAQLARNIPDRELQRQIERTLRELVMSVEILEYLNTRAPAALAVPDGGDVAERAADIAARILRDLPVDAFARIGNVLAYLTSRRGAMRDAGYSAAVAAFTRRADQGVIAPGNVRGA
jgi:hypothetical protein